MPCYLFTLHTYGSWMPDRPQGYVRRDEEGVLAPDRVRGNQYRAQMNDAAVVWTDPHRRAVRGLLIDAAARQTLCLHAVSVDQSHVHALVSWSVGRTVGGGKRYAGRSSTL